MKESEENLLLLERVQQDSQGLALLTIILNNDAAAADDFAGVAFLVNLTKTNHFSELLVVFNLDQGDVVLSTEGLNELTVSRLCAVGGQHAEMGLTLVQGLSSLVQTTGQTIIDQSFLQDLTQNVRMLSQLSFLV